MHELLVSYDLMKRGYHVFRALSPTGPCDLAVLKGKSLLRIEVRTAYKRDGGPIHYKGKYDADVLALVTHDGEIEYRPAL